MRTKTDASPVTDGRRTEPMSATEGQRTPDYLRHRELNAKRFDTERDCVTDDTLLQIEGVCRQLQESKRRRDMVLKSKLSLTNQLASNTASVLGYRTGMDKAEREVYWKACKALVEKIVDEHLIALKKRKLRKKKKAVESNGLKIDEDKMLFIRALVLPCSEAIHSFDCQDKSFQKQMIGYARQLPVFEWFVQFRGLEAISLANIIGETGNLSNYPTVGKLWKRMGCFPFKKGDEVHAPSSWRKGQCDQKMTSEDWVDLGYCPRRRSVMYLIAGNFTRQCSGKNAEHAIGHPFMERYDEAHRVASAKHPDWKPIHLRNHALLLTGKRVLRELWIQWNYGPTSKV